ncbi:MAG: hypothetical protein ACKVJE_21935 [Pseudomonadales bacterium]
MKSIKRKEYRKIEDKRRKRLRRLLTTKKVVYCRNKYTAYASILSIFDISEDQLDSFINSYKPSLVLYDRDEYLGALLKYLQQSTPPEFHGTIYFHNARLPPKEFLKYGLSSRNAHELEMRIRKIFRTSPKAIRALNSIKGWDYLVSEDLGLCGTMLFERSGIRENFHSQPPEGFCDMVEGLDDESFLKKLYIHSTCCKVVSFYSEDMKNTDHRIGTLNGLIGYILDCHDKIDADESNLDLGYDGPGVTAKHIVAVNLCDELKNHECQQDEGDTQGESAPSGVFHIPPKVSANYQTPFVDGV